jgi:BA14K-like protein
MMRAAMIPAFLAAAFAMVAANAAPIAPLLGAASTSGAASAPPETVQFRGGNWRDHPLMYRGNWEWHQRQWDAIEGRRGYARSTPCARFRSYDPASHTYVNRSGRRARCR